MHTRRRNEGTGARARNLGRACILALAVALVVPAGATARDWPAWLTACGTARCGTLTVPLDRTSPEAGTIGLNVMVLPASDEAHRATDAITAITGGPGGASTELAPWAQATFLDAAEQRDIVLVDQRGTGKSRPLVCPSPALVTTTSPDQIRAYWAACLGGVGVDPRLFTTAVAMDDLDDVRAALGYPQLDVYGVSYGATAVQYYLLRHGEHVRSAILDGGTLLDIPIFERYALTSRQMLDRLFARCAAQKACHKAFPSPALDLRTLLARLDRAPVRVQGMTIGRDELATAVQYLSRKPDTAARIPLLLRRAAKNGVASIVPAVAGMLPTGTDSPQVMFWAITCLEPWARRSESETTRLGATSYLGATMIRAAHVNAAACSAMPPFTDVPGADRRVPSTVPALAIVGGQDPQDPLANIAGITGVMPNARVVVVRGAGHGAVDHGCAGDLANAFIVRGTAAGLDIRCASKAPLTPFVLR